VYKFSPMIPSLSSYSRVPVDVQDVPCEDIDVEATEFIIKVLLKEKAHEVKVTGGQTVSQLKADVTVATGVAPERQRLITAGKTVGPNNASLTQVGLKSGSTVHLFPLREAATSSPAPTSSNLPSEVPQQQRALSVSFGQRVQQATGRSPIIEEFPGITAMHFDEDIVTSARDVKIWSMILFLLSLLSIINNVSMALVEGRLGANWLDAFVNLGETAASTVGLHVARLGMYGAASMDAQALRKHVWLLLRLGAVCVALRVLWVVDMYFTVSAAVAASEHEPPPESDDLAFSGGTDDGAGEADTGSSPPMDPKMVGAVVAQAALIALLVVAAWAHCYMRAAQLHASVAAFGGDDTPQPEEPATEGGSAPAAVPGAPRGRSFNPNGRVGAAGTSSSGTNSYTTLSITRNPLGGARV
jgi:hypothetical protein